MSLPDYLQQCVSADTLFLTLPEPFEFESGETIEDFVVAYQTWGTQRGNGQRTILICHALTGSADVDAWWPGIIGAGKAFDPDYDFVVCVNIPGSCYGTTGPAHLVPGTGHRYRADYPAVTVRDMVQVEKQVLDFLGVDVLDVVTGPSLGGMQALEWAASYPDRVSSVIPIGVGGRHSPWCIGVSEAQRAAIAADPNWKEGYYDDASPPEKGLAAARMMAICTYRSWDSFEARFGRETCDDERFQVQSYLQHQGHRINQRFDANCYVTLTHAMHSHDLSRGRGEYHQVLSQITQPALVVSVSSDALYPPQEQAVLADCLPNAEYVTLETQHGHDGFLIETQALGELIREFRLGAGQKAATAGAE